MENEKKFVHLKKIIDEFNLHVIMETEGYEEIEITTTDVLRPGFQLASGFYEYFDSNRILLYGRMENAYLESVSSEERKKACETLFSYKPPVLILTRGLEPPEEMVECARNAHIPLLGTDENTSNFTAAIIASLNLKLAPEITRHGVLVEAYGEGILILGESGVGKSETAIELVKRGHRLVADDAVVIKRVSSKTLVGSSPSVIKHFVEIRGIGIVDIQKIFGMGAVKDTEKIDLILNLEAWQEGKEYERLGLDDEYTEILGIKIPSITVPVKPGRNLAVIVEVAAMNHRQKKMGYNAVKELNDRLMNEFGEK